MVLLKSVTTLSPLQVLAAGSAATFLWVLALIAHRLLFHTLRRYPGPKLAAVTNWYALFFLTRGDLHVQTHRWHQKYGPVVRLGPNSLCFATDTAYTDIYNIRANVRKDESYAALSVSRRTPNLITSVDKDTTKFKRKAHMSILAQKSVEELQDRLLAKIDTFLSVVGRDNDTDGTAGERGDWGSSIDMAQEASCLTLETIADLCFGQSLPFMEDTDHRWALMAIKTMSWRGILHAFQPLLYTFKLERPILYILAPYYRLMGRLGTWAYEYTIARTKINPSAERRDFFTAALQSEDPKTGLRFGIKDLWVESVLLLVAGSDTTATTMSSVLFHLLHHPHALERVIDEVRATFTTKDQIVLGNSLKSCTYLESCIKEALRMTPAVANFKPRLVEAGGTVVDGHYVPEGTFVGASLHALHRNKHYFNDPDDFEPQRWTEDDGKSIRAYYPFSAGPRMCVGMKLAWAEMSITLARLLFTYDVRLAPCTPCCKPEGPRCEYTMKAFATGFVQGPILQFRARNLHHGV